LLSSVYSYTEREKKQVGTLRKEGIFVGYCEVSKAFRIYIPGHRHIEISRDVTFDEEATLKKSRRCKLEEMYEEEPVNPRTTESVRVLSTKLHKLDCLKSRQRMSKQCSYMQNSVIQQALKRPRFPYFHFVISVLSMRECKRLLATLDLGVGTYSGVFFTC
jgi:hypothetical protein